LKTLILADGPAASKAKVIDDLRKRLAAAGKAANGAATAGEADEICRISQVAKTGFQDRAAPQP
jgi:hypothetical protein